jgi:histidinol-phosphate/aromatic aminotransferase/cobyric acid decarboxylase-like protein
MKLSYQNSPLEAVDKLMDELRVSNSSVFVLGPTDVNFYEGIRVHTPENIWDVNIFCDIFFSIKFHDAEGGEINASKYRLVYIDNPNRCTGVLYPTGDIADLAKAFPKTFFIINESHHYFVEERDYREESVEELLSLGNVALVEPCDPPCLQEVRETVNCRNWFSKSLAKENVKVYNKNGDFVVVKHKKHKKILEELSGLDILMNDMSEYPQMDNCIQIGTNGGKKMELILSEIKRQT